MACLSSPHFGVPGPRVSPRPAPTSLPKGRFLETVRDTMELAKVHEISYMNYDHRSPSVYKFNPFPSPTEWKEMEKLWDPQQRINATSWVQPLSSAGVLPSERHILGCCCWVSICFFKKGERKDSPAVFSGVLSVITSIWKYFQMEKLILYTHRPAKEMSPIEEMWNNLSSIITECLSGTSIWAGNSGM